MKYFNVGILGTGSIAQSMAFTLNALKDKGDVVPYAIASRSLEKAEKFAQEWHFEQAYDNYEALVSDPSVDLIYIATPHSLHYEHALLCLNHGKNTLVEKSFTANALQAQELLSLAADKKVLLAEAIWTRYMPSRKIITDLLDSGAIGRPTTLEAAFSVPIHKIPRMHDPALCGGTLLDLGVYVLTTASIYFGNKIVKTDSSCSLYPTGVDATDNITLTYEDGKKAILHASMTEESYNCVKICGSIGYLTWESNNNPRNIELHSSDGSLLQKISVPEQINGYEYEILACKRAIEDGKTECEDMPHAETLTIMKQMNSLRQEWGIKYPFEL